MLGAPVIAAGVALILFVRPAPQPLPDSGVPLSFRSKPALVLARDTRAARCNPGATVSSAFHIPPTASMLAAMLAGIPLVSKSMSAHAEIPVL